MHYRKFTISVFGERLAGEITSHDQKDLHGIAPVLKEPSHDARQYRSRIKCNLSIRGQMVQDYQQGRKNLEEINKKIRGKLLHRNCFISQTASTKRCHYLDFALPSKELNSGLLLASSFLVLAFSFAAGLATLVAFFIRCETAKPRFLYRSVFFIPIL